MSARLLADAFDGIDDDHRGQRVGGAADHVADELTVARRVDDRILPRGAAEPDAVASMVTA